MPAHDALSAVRASSGRSVRWDAPVVHRWPAWRRTVRRPGWGRRDAACTQTMRRPSRRSRCTSERQIVLWVRSGCQLGQMSRLIRPHMLMPHRDAAVMAPRSATRPWFMPALPRLRLQRRDLEAGVIKDPGRRSGVVAGTAPLCSRYPSNRLSWSAHTRSYYSLQEFVARRFAIAGCSPPWGRATD